MFTVFVSLDPTQSAPVGLVRNFLVHSCIFAVLLSPVLDEFERQLSLGTVHLPSSPAVIESQ